MRYSRALLPTLKEAPAEATSTSHVLLLRAGFVRRVGAGIYSFLPLGVRVLRKIEQIVRAEMNAAGAEEVLLPALLPAEYFKETGRWDLFGDTLLRLKDRKGADYHLGPTHEEIITDLARREVKSYRDLPKNLYQRSSSGNQQRCKRKERRSGTLMPFKCCSSCWTEPYVTGEVLSSKKGRQIGPPPTGPGFAVGPWMAMRDCTAAATSLASESSHINPSMYSIAM